MNLDHAERLRRFDEDIAAGPENAELYATNDFLGVLHAMITSDEGDLSTLKRAIRSFATTFPYVFKTVCGNEAETRMWNNATQIIHKIKDELLNHPNVGVRINAIKCMQVLTLVLSRRDRASDPREDIVSLDRVRDGHGILNTQQLEKEGKNMLDKILVRLCEKTESPSILTAIVHCLVPLTTRRPQFGRLVSSTFLYWNKAKPQKLDPIDIKCIEKAIRIAFIPMIEASANDRELQKELVSGFTAIGGDTSIFKRRGQSQGRDRRDTGEESRRSKRVLPKQETDSTVEREKRIKREEEYSSSATPPPPSVPASSELLSRFDITTIPLAMAADILIEALQRVTPQDMERVHRWQEVKKEPSSTKSSDVKVPKEQLAAAGTSRPSAPQPEQPELPRVQLASVQERATQSLRMQPYELPEPEPLDSETLNELLSMAVERILDSEQVLQPDQREDFTESFIRLPGWQQSGKTVWLLLVSKLITRGLVAPSATDTTSSNDDPKPAGGDKHETEQQIRLKERLVDFVLDNLPKRLDLALEWLHEEFQCDMIHKRQNEHYEPVCKKWQTKLLERGIHLLRDNGERLARLLLNLPILSLETIDFVSQHMLDPPAQYIEYIPALCQLVVLRPPIRQPCLDILLEHCIDPDEELRAKSIHAVEQWVPDHTALSSLVEQFAIQNLHASQEPKTEEITETKETKETDDTAAMETDEPPPDPPTSEQTVMRYAGLFFALCIRKPALLHELFRVYATAKEQFQHQLRALVKDTIKAIGLRSPDLLDALRDIPTGGETLAIRILVILCSNDHPTPELVEVVKQVYQERQLDATFLIPVISGLSKNDIRSNLPKIVGLLNNTEGKRRLIQKAFSRIVSGGQTEGASMTPEELLVALHEMEENVEIPQAGEAIRICLGMPEIFDSKHIVAALRYLIEQPKIPILLMITMIHTAKMHRELTKFVVSLLQRLVAKKVWSYTKLWEGFLKCAEKTLPDSLWVVQSLPKVQLKDVLEKIPSLHRPLRQFAEENRILPVLGLMKKMDLIKDE